MPTSYMWRYEEAISGPALTSLDLDRPKMEQPWPLNPKAYLDPTK